jgi:hypothetical protein
VAPQITKFKKKGEIIMTKRETREQFLRSRGSFSAREQRERFMQKHELREIIARLKRQIADHHGYGDEKSVVLRAAWIKDLHAKLQLILKLERGEPIPAGRITSAGREVAVLQKLARRRAPEKAMLFEER